MKYEDISGLDRSELLKKSAELREELFEAKMKNALGQLANPMSIRWIRRDIARLKMALSQQGANSNLGTKG